MLPHSEARCPNPGRGASWGGRAVPCHAASSQYLSLEALGAVCLCGEPRGVCAGRGWGALLRRLSPRHRLSLLERVSAEAVTTTLHQVTRERMEDRCRGEYERSFLREFHKVSPAPSRAKKWPNVEAWVEQGLCGGSRCLGAGWRPVLKGLLPW